MADSAPMSTSPVKPELTPEQSLALAKKNFLQTAKQASPMNFVEKRPLTSIGCAFILGIGVSFLGRGKAPAVMDSLIQLSELATSMSYLLTRARGSGG